MSKTRPQSTSKELDFEQLKLLLEEKFDAFNRTSFIETDPIQIPHAFTKQQDIEIAALFSSTIAWGNRKSIIKNAGFLMELMDRAPYDFILNASAKEIKTLKVFVHRTFNGEDAIAFVLALRRLYTKHKSLEFYFDVKGNAMVKISNFRNCFLKGQMGTHVTKHLSDPEKGSAAKRLNMFLRWMVRSDQRGIDFGLWKKISAADLMLPLDVHTGTVARKLKLLQRKQDDRKAVEEVTAALRKFDPKDPVKYDYALFGLGAFEKF